MEHIGDLVCFIWNVAKTEDLLIELKIIYTIIANTGELQMYNTDT